MASKMYLKPCPIASTVVLLAYFKPLGALGLLLTSLAHLVLHSAEEAQLGRNGCLQLYLWLFINASPIHNYYKGRITCLFGGVST